MQHAKSLFDELVAAGQPLFLENFNHYIFCGLHDEFKLRLGHSSRNQG
jgi:hypothetical protein